MQKQKENIKQTILDVSKREFVKNGFQKTSMRVIAKKAKVSLSNIYNYFQNKDQIFAFILEPLIRKFQKRIKEHNDKEHISMEIFYSNDFHIARVKEHIDLAINYKTELDLLLFKSAGSELADYKDKLIDQFSKVGVEYLQLMNEKFPEVNAHISDFFIHVSTAWWVNVLEEIVMHNLEKEDLRQFIDEYVRFTTAGWQKLMIPDE